jgi:hypothetical protein
VVSRRGCLVAAAVVFSCTGSGGGGGLPSLATNAPMAEKLTCEPYAAGGPWQQVLDRDTRQGSTEIWVPQGQTLQGAARRVRKNVAFNPAMTAVQAAQFSLIDGLTGCDKGAIPQLEGPDPGTEDGFDVAYGESTCALGAIQHHLLVKAIRGQEAVYSIEVRFNADPSADELSVARDFLAKEVYLCPVARGAGRCANAR